MRFFLLVSSTPGIRSFFLFVFVIARLALLAFIWLVTAQADVLFTRFTFNDGRFCTFLCTLVAYGVTALALKLMEPSWINRCHIRAWPGLHCECPDETQLAYGGLRRPWPACRCRSRTCHGYRWPARSHARVVPRDARVHRREPPSRGQHKSHCRSVCCMYGWEQLHVSGTSRISGCVRRRRKFYGFVLNIQL